MEVTENLSTAPLSETTKEGLDNHATKQSQQQPSQHGHLQNTTNVSTLPTTASPSAPPSASTVYLFGTPPPSCPTLPAQVIFDDLQVCKAFERAVSSYNIKDEELMPDEINWNIESKKEALT